MKPTKLLMALATASLLIRPLNLTAAPLYENNFEKVQVGSVPDDFLVLDGDFSVREQSGNKHLELPGAPLETFGVLFGSTERENVSVSARIYGTAKGRRAPTFGVGLNGVGGYRFQVSPAKKAVELFKRDELCATLPYDWDSGKWSHFRLQIRKLGEGKWRVEGKLWSESNSEPGDWMLTFDETEEPIAGRPTIWGSPYATTPIYYDDLLVQRTSSQP